MNAEERAARLYGEMMERQLQERIKQERDRYRKALDLIANCDAFTAFGYQTIARQALDESEIPSKTVYEVRDDGNLARGPAPARSLEICRPRKITGCPCGCHSTSNQCCDCGCA